MLIDNLIESIDNYYTRIKNALNDIIPFVTTSNTTNTLNGRTTQDMKDVIDAHVQTHVNKVATNPHRLSSEDLNTYDHSEFEVLLAQNLQVGFLPITRYGALDTNPLDISSTGFILTINESGRAIINGVSGNVTPTQLDLAAEVTQPQNTTIYIYIHIDINNIVYSASLSPQEETKTQVLLGEVITDASGIQTIHIDKLTMYAGYRLSETPRAKAIPITPGLPMDVVPLNPGWFKE